MSYPHDSDSDSAYFLQLFRSLGTRVGDAGPCLMVAGLKYVLIDSNFNSNIDVTIAFFVHCRPIYLTSV